MGCTKQNLYRLDERKASEFRQVNASNSPVSLVINEYVAESAKCQPATQGTLQALSIELPAGDTPVIIEPAVTTDIYEASLRCPACQWDECVSRSADGREWHCWNCGHTRTGIQ